jgi:2-polyprenyl-3-methyl-5-hydroxy-6-metoxy-1,4-benzoquinol methylase
MVSAELFFKKANSVIGFTSNDVVLDIGCGPGYLELFLAPIVKHIDCVDVSKQFIDIYAKQCERYSNVSTGYLDKDDYTNLNEITRG